MARNARLSEPKKTYNLSAFLYLVFVSLSSFIAGFTMSATITGSAFPKLDAILRIWQHCFLHFSEYNQKILLNYRVLERRKGLTWRLEEKLNLNDYINKSFEIVRSENGLKFEA